MALCKVGQIQNCCHPNALMTLQEFLTDYASPETKKTGEELISRELLNVPDEKRRERAEKYLESIKNGGERDFRF